MICKVNCGRAPCFALCAAKASGTRFFERRFAMQTFILRELPRGDSAEGQTCVDRTVDGVLRAATFC